MNTDKIVKIAIVASIYAMLTITLSPLSYGPIQFRISEVLILLAFINSDYIIGLTIGCFIANLLGPYGLADIVFGTFATLVSAYLVNLTSKLIKNKYAIWIASLWPVLANAIIVGSMLNIFFDLPILLCMLEVGIGEFGVVTIMGVPLFNLLLKYPGFSNIREA